MCGIVGIAGPLPVEKIQPAIEKMNAAIAHRGPDDEGSWVAPGFGFAMRRLSIIDLSGGHQPMWDEHAETGIVYNGEVYNYRALRAELEKAGHRFRTTSDTEVVLKSLAVNDTAAVHSWNGMFAVASWNKRLKQLTLIRDRLGVKPLYYFWDGSFLIFASEIKALLASGLFKPELNLQAIWDYLTFQYIPGPQTIWRQIWKLEPGHLLKWSSDAKPEISCYWRTDVEAADRTFDQEQSFREFETLFLNSVELRLLASDVPVGVFLSGGLDSSAVAAAAVELGHRSFNTFSVSFADGGKYSELPYARAVAEHVGAHHHEVVVDRATFFEVLPEAVRSTDEPLADLTTIPLLMLSRLARQHVKVVLSGEGSDEVLAGYGFDRFVRKRNLIKRLQTLPRPLLKAASRAVRLLSERQADLLKKVATIPLADWNAAHKNHMTRAWTQPEKKALWSGFPGEDSDRVLAAMYAAAASDDPLEQILSVYQKSWLVEDLLMKADKMSMAASLEVRVPFLDYRLVEWANRQPPALKVGIGQDGHYQTKLVLREFARKRLPKTIIDRPKLGFPVPAYNWLRDDKINRWAHEHLTGRRSRLAAALKSFVVEEELSLASHGESKAAHKIWLLVVLETWLRAYDVELTAAAPAMQPALAGIR
ncbi:MAG TPA: asparagine synthase (glutamine-hydrolyzing) [Candidatus Eisenbacteria bacterium]|nr:asparagine synthase (glutamine-hydrolyzing) [Candidatus Eisenbacteria bacterium]